MAASVARWISHARYVVVENGMEPGPAAGSVRCVCCPCGEHWATAHALPRGMAQVVGTYKNWAGFPFHAWPTLFGAPPGQDAQNTITAQQLQGILAQAYAPFNPDQVRPAQPLLPFCVPPRFDCC